MRIIHFLRLLILTLLILTTFAASTLAQEVSIPDPGLNAAIREVLQKPNGPLTEQDLLSLINLSAQRRNISSLAGLESARNLTSLDLTLNRLGNFSYPAALTKLRVLNLSLNSLTNCTLPDGLTNLTALILENNWLTNFNFPAGLTALNTLVLSGNQLAELTLPPDLTKLTSLVLNGNPLTTLVLSEPLAATNLAVTVAQLRNQGDNVFTYPLAIQLIRIQQPIGAFQFAITGPPGIYTVFSSTDLTTWSVLRTTSNPLGKVVFTDGTAHFSPQKFYRALLQDPPNAFSVTTAKQ